MSTKRARSTPTRSSAGPVADTLPALPPRHPNQTPPALTRARQRALLERIAATGRIKRSCLELGIDVCAPVRWANMSESFAKKLAEAKTEGEKVLLAEYEHSLDDTVLAATDVEEFAKVQNSRFFRMKKLDPSYRDNAQVNVQAHGPVAIAILGDQSQEPK